MEFIKVKGKILSEEKHWNKKELVFRPMGLNKVMKLDIFTGCKLFKCASFSEPLQSRVKELMRGGKFEATGYCYNSETLIVETIKLEDEHKSIIDGFLSIIRETLKKK